VNQPLTGAALGKRDPGRMFKIDEIRAMDSGRTDVGLIEGQRPRYWLLCFEQDGKWYRMRLKREAESKLPFEQCH
jgi:hypothetical protein